MSSSLSLSSEIIINVFFLLHRINNIIQDRSNQTAVTFLYLAPPPIIDSPDWQEASRQYLDLLTELTSDLPPTILVHGVHTVTSTTL